jgi:tol-pal system protein YbgF
MKKLLSFWVLSLSVSGAVAAVPVEDIQQRGVAAAPPPVQQPSQVANTLPEPEPLATDNYSQLQLLREEVMELRGLVEQLNNEVQRLKQRQMDDYMDLDRRISNGPAAAPSVASSGNTQAGTPATGIGGDDEVQAYSDAYNLLKDGKVDSAVTAFKGYLERYPTGKYAANSYYWLGEVYLLKGDLEQSRQAFTQVVESYPAHRKVDDATFKLGKVYHLLGNTKKAKELLNSVASGTSSTAPLATKYLSDNF